jgi:hypothetical protein
MSAERKTAANNNGYPTTVYGAPSVGALGKKGAAVADDGSKHQYVAEYVIDVTDLPATSADDPSVYTFPAGAVPTRVDVTVLETMAGGAGVDVGLSTPAGVVYDADGLVDGFAGTAVGAYAKGAGTKIDTAFPEAEQLTVTTDRTSGKFLVRVYYNLAQV